MPFTRTITAVSPQPGNRNIQADVEFVDLDTGDRFTFAHAGDDLGMATLSAWADAVVASLEKRKVALTDLRALVGQEIPPADTQTPPAAVFRAKLQKLQSLQFLADRKIIPADDAALAAALADAKAAFSPDLI